SSNSCPKIVEHFGAAEMWGLTLSPSFVGTSADKDIPLPSNVRRYYIPSTQHGGGQGGFSVNPPNPPMCPGPNFGVGMFAANPVPHTETVTALRFHFRNWVMKDMPMPPSSYPTLANGNLVDPVKEAVGFPNIPGVPRLSLEERYKHHEGYVAAVRTASAKAVAAGLLLQADADKLIADAVASNVLIPSSTSR